MALNTKTFITQFISLLIFIGLIIVVGGITNSITVTFINPFMAVIVLGLLATILAFINRSI